MVSLFLNATDSMLFVEVTGLNSKLVTQPKNAIWSKSFSVVHDERMADKKRRRLDVVICYCRRRKTKARAMGLV